MCIEVITHVFGCMSIFMGKNVYYVDMVYLRYFIDFEEILEYNLGAAYCFYMYSKLGKVCL